jgi:hypothetical protein
MDRGETYPLDTEEAKARLRAATSPFSPRDWFLRRKWRLLGLAFATGYFAARLPASAGKPLLRYGAPMLLSALSSWRGERE